MCDPNSANYKASIEPSPSTDKALTSSAGLLLFGKQASAQNLSVALLTNNQSRLDGVATPTPIVARAVSRVVSNPPRPQIQRHRVPTAVVDRTFLVRLATPKVLLADVVQVPCTCDVSWPSSSAQPGNDCLRWGILGTAGKHQITVFGRADVKADAPLRPKLEAHQA